MDSSDLYETREGDLELKGDVKPINYDVPATEIGEIEKNDLETKELKGEELSINFEMSGPDVAVTEEISMPETEELITGRSVGEEIENSPIELGDDIVISEGENKIDFQQYSLKNIKDAEDEQDAVTLKQLNEYTPEIADGSITSAKLADGVVTTAKIADEAVTTAKIGNSQITGDKIASNAITTSKVLIETLNVNDVTEASGITIGDFECQKILGYVIINMTIPTVPVYTSWRDFFTLPTGWRPGQAVSPYVMVADTYITNAELQTNGTFHARFKDDKASTTLRIQAIYKVATASN